jgi:hypothetical protein
MGVASLKLRLVEPQLNWRFVLTAAFRPHTSQPWKGFASRGPGLQPRAPCIVADSSAVPNNAVHK